MLGTEISGELGSPADSLSHFSCSPFPPMTGIRSWDIDPSICSLDEQLKVFVSRHSATFSSIVKGETGDPACLSCSPSICFTRHMFSKCELCDRHWGEGGVRYTCKEQQ